MIEMSMIASVGGNYLLLKLIPLFVFQVPTGSMSGLILNDRVEVHHILRPSVRASGRVARAHQLNCTVEVSEGTERKKLQETLDTIYLVCTSWSLL